MFIALGILLILFALGMEITKNVVNAKIDGARGNGKRPPVFPTMITNWTRRNSITTTVAGALCIATTGLFFYNPAGTAVAVQYLTGSDKAITTQGVKLKWWGRTIPISFEIAMQDYIERRDTITGAIVSSHKKEEGIYYRQAHLREFADAIKANIASSLIVSISYNDEEQFLTMADKNKSEKKLVYARIYPVYDQAVKNTCKLMDAQDYISGASSQFDYYLKDQMENGMYMTEEVYKTVETEQMGDDSTMTLRSVAKGVIDSEKSQKKYRIKVDANGDPIRDTSNSLKRYGLTVQQAAVTDIDWEDSFDQRLTLQKEQVAQTQLEKQETVKEFYAAQKAVAQGEREKAQVRVTFEKAQLEATISAETAAKEASYKEQEESNLAAAAKKRAERIRISADADAYEIRQKVSAGITPEKKLQMELDARTERTKALAGPEGVSFPHNYIITNGGGKSGNQDDPLMRLLMMEMVDQKQGANKK